jgi:hypothetical protein
MMPSQSRVKLNRRGLTELVLICAFLALLTFAVWSWQTNGGHVTAMESALSEPQSALLPQVLHHPAIILTAVIAEFILLLAFVLAVVPMGWWLRMDYIVAGQPAAPTTLLRWLAQLLRPRHGQETLIEGEIALNEAGEPLDPQQAAELAAYAAQQAEDAASQANSDQPPGGWHQNLNTVSHSANSTEAAAKVGTAQPHAPAEGPLKDVLNFDEEEAEEDDPLADLANIKDILSSAFDEDGGLDPVREALARDLEEINVMTIRKTAHQIVATFNQ